MTLNMTVRLDSSLVANDLNAIILPLQHPAAPPLRQEN